MQMDRTNNYILKNQNVESLSGSSQDNPRMLKQSLAKIVSKVKKVLPKSLSQKQYVMKAIAETMCVVSKEKNKDKCWTFIRK